MISEEDEREEGRLFTEAKKRVIPSSYDESIGEYRLLEEDTPKEVKEHYERYIRELDNPELVMR